MPAMNVHHPQFLDEVRHRCRASMTSSSMKNGNCVEDGLICFVLVCVNYRK
jgi:hypothetical protein